ncbi:MAG: hypothetical protein QM589_14765 [Thermomicrobiales bacterium]
MVSHLTFLRQLRNTADYDLDVSPVTIERMVAGAESFAHEVVAWLDAHAERIERERMDEAGPEDESGEGPLS